MLPLFHQIDRAMLRLESLFDQAVAELREIYGEPQTPAEIRRFQRNLSADCEHLEHRLKYRSPEQAERIDRVLQIVPESVAAALLTRIGEIADVVFDEK